MRTLLPILNSECFHDRRFRAKSSPKESAFDQQLDHPTPKDLDHRLEPEEWYIEEGTRLVETSFQHQAVVVGIPPQLIFEPLVRNNESRKKRSAGGLVVELTEDGVDQSGNVGEQSPVVAEERTQRFRHGEDELAVWQFEKDLVGDMLSKEYSTFTAA